MKNFRKQPTAPVTKESGWTVYVGNAYRERLVPDYYDYSYRETLRPVLVEGKIAVRLMLDGNPQVTVGCVSVMAPNFEDQITTLRAIALERAATLNAVGAGA